MSSKQCTKCKTIKPLTDFGKRSYSPDGLQYWCKPCRNEEARKRRASKPTKLTPEQKQRANEASKKWRSKNKELARSRAKEYTKNWRAKLTPEQKQNIQEYHKQYIKQHRKNNKDKYNSYTAKYRAAVHDQSPELTESQNQWMQAIYKRAKLLSEITGIQYHVDHIWPISKGGLHVPWNLQVIPATDNIKKGASIIL